MWIMGGLVKSKTPLFQECGSKVLHLDHLQAIADELCPKLSYIV